MSFQWSVSKTKNVAQRWLCSQLGTFDGCKWFVYVWYNVHKMCAKFWSPTLKIKGDMGMSTIFETSEYPRIVDKCVKMRNMRKRSYCRFSVVNELGLLLLGGQRSYGIIVDVFVPGQRPVTSQWRHNRKFWKWPMKFETDQVLIDLILWVSLDSFGSIAHSDRVLRAILGVDSVVSEVNQKFG